MLYRIDFWKAVGVVAFNTRLGCLEPDLAADSEAMKMIGAANVSFSVCNELEMTLPVWKLIKTPKLRQAYEAQDFLTELILSTSNRKSF